MTGVHVICCFLHWCYNAMCTECQCAEPGSIEKVCREDGQCPCRPNFGGRTCSRCHPGYYRYPDCSCMYYRYQDSCIISTFIWFSEWSWTWFNFWLLLFQPVTVTGMARLVRLVSSCLDSVSVDPLLMVWAVTSVKMDSTTTQCVKVIYSTACQNSSVSLQHWKLWMKVYISKGVFSNFRV